MKAIDRLSVIRHKSKINKDWKHKDLFRILRKNDIWIAAYVNISNTKSIVTSLIINESLQVIPIKRLVKLRDKVINESYHFKLVNEIEILKSNERNVTSELPTADDKIVQEVIRMILEAIYEPCFLKQSFGFHQGLGTHDALAYIESNFCWVDQVIEGGTKSRYANIDHPKLFTILSKKIQDTRFMNLIHKLLKLEVLQQSLSLKFNCRGFQKSIIFPLFTNIYFNELDKWIENKVNVLYQSWTNQRNKKYTQLSYQIEKRARQGERLRKASKAYKNLLEELKALKIQKTKVPILATQQIQIEYVRYAASWMIGIKGDQILAQELKIEVNNFMMIRLSQTVHPKKTKIINLRSGKLKFLGYEIYILRNAKTSLYKTFNTHTTFKTNFGLRFDIPICYILKKIEERGYIKKLVKGHRPISKTSYTTLEDIVIVKHFAQVWRGLLNYYSGSTNPSKLQYIHYLLHASCAMTLGHRHRLNMTKIFAKHGKTLKISNGHISLNFPYRKEWDRKKRKWFVGIN
mmetsp:Transcript_37340/g.63597  ORF Transcript_37340/g.63597 Transcript_37340/m.63597 type:complete len:518 (-) Transcript_37340:634-2187(-)